MKKYIFFEGKSYESIAKLADEFGIKPVTLRTRLRKGLSIEEALSQDKLNCRKVTYNNVEFSSIRELCKTLNIDESLLNNRLRQGWSIKEAVEADKTITKQGKVVFINGKVYNSIKEASEKLNINESKLRRILNKDGKHIKNKGHYMINGGEFGKYRVGGE